MNFLIIVTQFPLNTKIRNLLIFTNVLWDINNHSDLSKNLYKTQDELFQDPINYRLLNSPGCRTYKIKKCLHEIMTKAIFTYHLCKDLLVFCKNNSPPAQKWIENLNNK